MQKLLIIVTDQQTQMQPVGQILLPKVAAFGKMSMAKVNGTGSLETALCCVGGGKEARWAHIPRTRVSCLCWLLASRAWLGVPVCKSPAGVCLGMRTGGPQNWRLEEETSNPGAPLPAGAPLSIASSWPMPAHNESTLHGRGLGVRGSWKGAHAQRGEVILPRS